MALQALVDRISERCGDKDAEAIYEIFNSFKLRPPQAGQYRKGHESDTVFFNSHGLVFRFAYAEDFPLSYKLRHNKDSLIAQPLKPPLDLDKLSFEILPALDCTEEASDTELSFLIDDLGSRGINFWDTKEGKFNTGRLPWKSEDFPNRLRVVTDRGGIRPQNDFTQAVGNAAFRKYIPANIQETLFSDFILALKKAWPEGDMRPNSLQINEFLDLCQEDLILPEDHPDKRLFSSGWGMHTVQKIAHSYEHNITI